MCACPVSLSLQSLLVKKRVSIILWDYIWFNRGINKDLYVVCWHPRIIPYQCISYDSYLSPGLFPVSWAIRCLLGCSLSPGLFAVSWAVPCLGQSMHKVGYHMANQEYRIDQPRSGGNTISETIRGGATGLPLTCVWWLSSSEDHHFRLTLLNSF